MSTEPDGAAQIRWNGSPIPVVGIGADGWVGLGRLAQEAIAGCDVLFGSTRQLDLVPETVSARRVSWPKPLLPALPGMLAAHADIRLGILASGDPMFYGIGTTLVRLLGPAALRILPQPSSAALACARLGWSLQEVDVVSAVARPVAGLIPALADQQRILVLSNDENTPDHVAEILCQNGFGAAELTVLEQLGGSEERAVSGTALGWSHRPGDPLNIVAVNCVADPARVRMTRTPGLPDSVYSGDGQLTKSEIRALTLAALAPSPGELLWDVGGGSGSVAIEWCRSDRACRAVVFERLEDRRGQISSNAVALGVPRIEVVGEVVAELAAREPVRPDAIFLGGGLTQDDLFETCWSQLRCGGRLVANAVTAESEALLVSLAAEYGGQLRRFQIYRGEQLGRFTSWRPQLPVVQWSVIKNPRSREAVS